MDHVATSLSELYAEAFGGKPNGRYRIPRKLVADLAGRRRLYEDEIRSLCRAMVEKGFVLVDMDAFFVVMSTKTFTNYRRANADVIATAAMNKAPKAC